MQLHLLFFQSSGNLASSNDCLNSFVSGSIIWLLVSFNIRGCIISGPCDFPAFMLLKDFSTVSLVISNSSSGCVMYLSSKCGRFHPFLL